MGNSPFFHFLTLSLFAERRKHLGVIALSVVLIFLLSATLFISSSLQQILYGALKDEPDFVVQRVRGDHLLPVPLEWADEIGELHGVVRIAPRVWGRYYTRPKGRSFLVVGVDFLDDQSQKALGKLIGTLDLKSFLSSPGMLVGAGVERWMKAHFYNDAYSFLTPSGEFLKVRKVEVIPPSASLVSDDMILVSIGLARRILGLGEEEATDITFDVPNDAEWSNIEDKVSALHYDLRIVSKKENRKAYLRLFDFKGGFFLVLFLIVLLAFALILYQRYSQVFSHEKRAIGILRAMGWSIRDVLKLKIFETLSIVLASFVLGTAAAYYYVFAFGAPLLRQIFLGSAELATAPRLVPVIDFSMLTSIFLLYTVTFLAAVLIPVWKIAVTDPKEAML
ncbi:ABC transporter permease [Nitratifractor sp.]